MKKQKWFWVFKWNFSNQCQCHYFRNISFVVYIWFVISCHVILSRVVVYNFILLGLYLNLKFWEKKLLKSVIATKSNNQNLFFERTLFVNHRNCLENFLAVWEKCKNRNCLLKIRIFESPFISSLFSFHCLSGWFSILVDFKRNRVIGMRIHHNFLF